VKRIMETTLKRIEKENPGGLTSKQILETFREHEVSFSEATLRKYVQLGLLPRSVRIGQKGKHRGSKGVYPVRVIRQIVAIKGMMADDYTIEQIQKEFLFPRGELSDLEQNLGGIFSTLDRAVGEEAPFLARTLKRDVRAAEGVSQDLMIRLRTLETQLLLARRGDRATPEGRGIQGAVG
jgi:hypothetical protein